MSPRIGRALLIVGILGVATGGAVLLVKLSPEPEKKDIETLPTLVEVMALETASATFSVSSQGTVRPRTETAFSAEVSGSILSVAPNFVAGGVFTSGEELLRIDPTAYAAAVAQAEAVLKQRQIEFDGARSLRSQGYRAEAEFAAAQAALSTAEASLVNARHDLAKTRISLPYAGMVRAKDADIGQFVTPGVRLGVAFATDYAEVRLPLTDRDLAFLRLPAPARADAKPGPEVTLRAERGGRPARWVARITRSEGVVDTDTRVSYAVARIDDPYQLRTDGSSPVLPIGTFVSARIDGTTVDNLIRVPRAVLRGRDQLVFVDDDDRVRLRTVDVLRSDAEYAWLAAGAAAGERISLTPLDSPVNGTLVRVDDGERGALARSAE